MTDKSTIAIDIETISSIDDPNPQNPDEIELLCIGVGYRESRDSRVETHVFLRRGKDPEHEVELLDRLYEWVLTHMSSRLLTYNGTKFDLVHLRGRAERAENEVRGEFRIREKIDFILEMHSHLDLFDVAREVYDCWPKLETVCQDNGIEVPETRYRGRVVENYMIPEIGERYLNSVEDGGRDHRVQRTLIEYARSDIEPLFEVMDNFEI